MNNQAKICMLTKCKYNIQNICHKYGQCQLEGIGFCKDCNMWKKGKTAKNKDWYSDEGFCTNWKTITGKNFYCGDFENNERR